VRGLIVITIATSWIIGLPPTDPTKWVHWFFDTSNASFRPPAAALGIFLIFIYLLVRRARRKYQRQEYQDYYSGSVEVSGVSILALSSGSIAGEAGMRKDDVIIEYASERDLTIERLAATTERGHEAGQVCVVFVRDGQQYSRMVKPGPLGISVMNTTINVLVRSE
jgi:hypothetical protein